MNIKYKYEQIKLWLNEYGWLTGAIIVSICVSGTIESPSVQKAHFLERNIEIQQVGVKPQRRVQNNESMFGVSPQHRAAQSEPVFVSLADDSRIPELSAPILQVAPVSSVATSSADQSITSSQSSKESETSSSISSVKLQPILVPSSSSSSSLQSQVSARSETPVASSSARSSQSSEITVTNPNGFPAFIKTTFPMARVPDWGHMRTPEEWNRTYSQMTEEDFVRIPRYNLQTLTIPMASLASDLSEENMQIITAKLTYSTRYFGAYDVDATEFTAVHPGIDIKLAKGTPIGAIAGGKVNVAMKDSSGLGLHVIIEHRLSDGSRFFSIYGHFDSISVKTGDTVKPGQMIGRVGMTGNTTAPHLHLQVDIGGSEDIHTPYWPASVPSAGEAAKHAINPILFIGKYSGGAE